MYIYVYIYIYMYICICIYMYIYRPYIKPSACEKVVSDLGSVIAIG